MREENLSCTTTHYLETMNISNKPFQCRNTDNWERWYVYPRVLNMIYLKVYSQSDSISVVQNLIATRSVDSVSKLKDI